MTTKLWPSLEDDVGCLLVDRPFMYTSNMGRVQHVSCVDIYLLTCYYRQLDLVI